MKLIWTVIFKIRAPRWHVIDLKDQYVLFSGTHRQCARVMDESYGGLFMWHGDARRHWTLPWYKQRSADAVAGIHKRQVWKDQ